ncbi:MAG: Rne/Rng family ribonuclease [Bacteroidia bacterium]
MNELVVSKSEDRLRIALLQNKQIVELHHEEISDSFAVGDIFLARVRKLVPGLNAAFIDVGHEKDAFLHYFDLGPQVQSLLRHIKVAYGLKSDDLSILEKLDKLPNIDKNGKMEDVLKPNQLIGVQIVKEPISTKGPRLSSELSIPGQYVVLVPFSEVVSVSKKIASAEERKRLKVLAESLKPRNFGVIVRTAAEGKDAAAINRDIQYILDKWRNMSRNIVSAKVPIKILSEQDRATGILRDMLSQGFDLIHVDDEKVHNDLKDYLAVNQPELVKSLRLHKGKGTLFHTMGVERQIKTSFGKVVSLPNGSYIVIEHTEAMHVVDVNSGSKNLNNTTLEENVLKVNMEAAAEIARQIRLRDLGGIIVIDFIDQKKPENKKQLLEHLKEVMKPDRAKHSILPVSKFGLVQITRQRVRPELNINTTEVCPTCNGSGKIQATILIDEEINNNVDFLIRQNKEKSLQIHAHPYVAAYLTKGFWKSQQMIWYRKYWVWVKVVADVSLAFSTVKYFNSSNEEIKL